MDQCHNIHERFYTPCNVGLERVCLGEDDVDASESEDTLNNFIRKAHAFIPCFIKRVAHLDVWLIRMSGSLGCLGH